MTHLPASRTCDGTATASPTDGPAWRTSSYSGNGDNCVEVTPWRTSTYTSNGEHCVELAPAAAGVLLRDTKDHGAGPVVAFTADQWAAFLQETATGAPSANGAVTVAHGAGGSDVHAPATGVRLRFTPGEWAAFRNGVLDGEFAGLATSAAG